MNSFALEPTHRRVDSARAIPWEGYHLYNYTVGVYTAKGLTATHITYSKKRGLRISQAGRINHLDKKRVCKTAILHTVVLYTSSLKVCKTNILHTVVLYAFS